MIEDSFIESHVVRDGGNKVVLRLVSIAALIAGIFAINVFGFTTFGPGALYITMMLSVTIIFGFVFMFKRSYTEYEMEISNDNVNVAKILGQSSRVELMDFSIKDCIFIGPVNGDRYEEDLKKTGIKIAITQKKDYPISEDVWYMTYKEEEYVCMLVFDFKPEMYKVFRRYNPRNVAFYKAPAKKETPSEEENA